MTVKVVSAPKKLGNAEFGAWLAETRKEAGMSRYDLAEACGISYPYVSQLETGYRNPSATVVRSLSLALGVDAGDVLARAFPPEMINEQSTMAMLRNAFARHPKLVAPDDKATVLSIDTVGTRMELVLSDRTTIILTVDRRENVEL